MLKKSGLLFPSLVFFAIQIFCAGCLGAAPLVTGFPIAPEASAQPDERAAAYLIARSQVLAAAAKYEHTPYRHAGVDQRGVDCSGLVFASFRDALGVSVPRTSEGLYTWTERIVIEDAEPGDLVFFRTTGSGRISHVGIFVGGGQFIHSASQGRVTGVIYSSLDERYWARAYAGAGRVFPAVDLTIGEGASP